MPFFNKYTTPSSAWKDAIKIGSNMYATGTVETDHAQLIKIASDGEVLWNKSFKATGISKLSFKKIVECSNSDLLVLGSGYPNQQAAVVSRITSSGIVLWSKSFSVPYVETVYYLDDIIQLAENSYLVRISVDDNHYLFKIKSDGSVVSRKLITGENLLQGLASSDNRIVLSGGGRFVELNHNLDIINKFYHEGETSAGMGGTSSRLPIYYNNKLFYIGDIPNSGHFIAAYPVQTNPNNFAIPIIEFTADGRAIQNFLIDENGDLLVFTTSIADGIFVYKLTEDFQLIWVKKIDLTGYANAISGIQAVGGSIEFLSNNQVLASIGSDLQSCKTISEQDANIIEGIVKLYSDLEANAYALDIEPTVVEVDEVTAPTVDVSVICVYGKQIHIDEKTMLQSSHLYLQAAGSQGSDSTEGIHLRWALKNALSNHLPKGNIATGTANFNKNNDFVTLYKVPYEAQKTILNLNTAPDEVNDAKKRWAYAVGTKMFYVHFRSSNTYQQIKLTVNPTGDPIGFLVDYCAAGGILEIENQTDLAFAATIKFNVATSTNVLLEFLSVEDNKVTAPKAVSLRQNKPGTAIHNTKYFSENIRSIRLQSTAAYPVTIEFEFYSDFISAANTAYQWDKLGSYALTLDDNEAYSRLEPVSGQVHGKWRRYNDGAFVNIPNYKTKWNGQNLPSEERIKEGVAKYISLSNAANNPQGMEEFFYDAVPTTAPESQEPEEEASSFEISNLYLLQVAALDYHVARMLGLGVLDTDDELGTGKFIYAAHYTTLGNLKDGKGAREVNHLYLTLPTGQNDQRLPLPINLKEPKPGIFTSNEIEAPASITDADGYTQDGRARFITLYNEDLPDEGLNAAFFANSNEFISAESTIPVFAGLEYKKSSENKWRKPELSFSKTYYNIDTTVSTQYEKSETLSIVVPEPGNPLFIHREKENGLHRYSSYGINWFSRATASTVNHDIQTNIKPLNLMLPPGNVQAVLVQKESPLLLTSAEEQDMLALIPDENDKTLVRLSFEYNNAQELISYHQKIGNETVSGYTELADNEEPFAEHLDIWYRNRVPGSIGGKVDQVVQDVDPRRSLVYTAPYVMTSTESSPNGVPQASQQIVPEIPTGTSNNYIGSVMLLEGKEYIIDQINISGAYPVFTVWKRQDGEEGASPALIAPGAGGMFMVVENMQTPSSWNTSYNQNPLSLQVNINHTTVHREEVITSDVDGILHTYVHKFRGIYRDASIAKVMENYQVPESDPNNPTIIQKHLGLYRLTFTGFTLAQHTQFQGANPVEFYNGVVRIHTLADAQGTRKVLKVVRTENIGIAGQPLIIYASDAQFPSDGNASAYEGKLMADNVNSITQKVNYYPGYKAYLYANASHGLTEQYLLPQEGEDIHYSIFGFRSYDSLYGYYSQFSMPALLLARRIEEPEQPEKPLGKLYATRPDFFGKSTYTFTTKFKHKPYSIQYGRASDIQILTTLYNPNVVGSNTESTLATVMEIFNNDDASDYMKRWENLMSFPDSIYADYPSGSGVRLPVPDNPLFMQAINRFIADHNIFYTGEDDISELTSITSLNQIVVPLSDELHGELTIADFVKDVILNCFVPLTEIPVLFQHIKTDYTPIPKKQVVRDRDGNLLRPEHPDFDMAPMMKVVTEGNEPVVQFTDFGIDGASNARYLYIAKEINQQMQSGPYSIPIGPITLVNTAPPPAPEIVKVLPILENKVLEIVPAVEFKINAYPKVQGITKINIFRASAQANSLSVRTMELIKIIDIADELEEGETWTFRDDFSDLPFVPYGDMLYYKLTVARRIVYEDSNNTPVIDYTPSEASKLIITNVVNNYAQDSPLPWYTSDDFDGEFLNSVILEWDQTVYNGKYHLYKISNQGNWVKVNTIITNDSLVSYEIGNLKMVDDNGNPVRHHFKILAENFSGMISTKENILTIYISEEGIGAMIIEDTFIVS